MSEGIVSISDVVWEKWVVTFAAANNKNVREVLYEEWPLLMRKVMDYTPPFKVRALFDSANAAHASDLSIGRKAVSHDIYKTMQPFDPAEIRSPGLKKIVETKDTAAFNAMAARSTGRMAQLQAIPFDPGTHTRQRNSRGRVTGRDRNVVVLGTDVQLLKAYVVQMQSRVGWAKAGWLKALLLVGGEAPGYVMNKGTSGGDVIDDHADEDNPSITAINRTPWAIRKDEADRILSDAKAIRIEMIIKKTKLAALRAGETASAG